MKRAAAAFASVLIAAVAPDASGAEEVTVTPFSARPSAAFVAVFAAIHAIQAGGAGYYARSDFMHLDSGRVRRW